MEDQNAEVEKREAIFIEIDWNNDEDLHNLSKEPQFVEFILEESLKAIIHALENKLETAELFNIFNMSVIVQISRAQFSKVLSKINKLFIWNEEYERCNEIKKLKEKYEI